MSKSENPGKTGNDLTTGEGVQKAGSEVGTNPVPQGNEPLQKPLFGSQPTTPESLNGTDERMPGLGNLNAGQDNIPLTLDQEIEKARALLAANGYTVQETPSEPPHQPTESPEDLLISEYGADYVTGSKDGQTQYFTQTAWGFLGNSDNHDGWKRKIAAPPEVQALKH